MTAFVDLFGRLWHAAFRRLANSRNRRGLMDN